jgi:hypothetical protein
MRFIAAGLIGLTGLAGLTGCGNADDGSSADGDKPASVWSQPTPAEGYTRFEPETIEVAPGEDGTWCQWLTGPAEADIDIMDITGEQPFPGHHAILVATRTEEPVGTTKLCSEVDQSSTKLLGGVGGEGSASAFPEGAVLRLRKGESLLMNTHYLNTSDKPVIGRAMLDVKFKEPSPDHVVASFFVNITVKYNILPQSQATAEATCVLPRDVQLIDFANHMHDFGSKVLTEEVRAGGEKVDLLRDETWLYEWQFNPVKRKWSVKEPHVLKAGDTLHTQCTWSNTSAEAITFPREMCVGAGFILADNDITCVDGEWKE